MTLQDRIDELVAQHGSLLAEEVRAKVIGVGRDAENDKALVVYFDKPPSDGGLRGLDEMLRARVELEQECNDLREENDMLRQVNGDLGTEAETAEALLKRWVAFFDTTTRSEPFKCIAEDSRRWIKAANAELRGASQLAGAASRSNAGLGEEG